MLRTIPPDSAQADTTTMNPETAAGDTPADPAHIPRRNLSQAFDELYIAPTADTPNTATPADKDKMVLSANLISPTGVADLHASPPKETVSPEPAQPPIPFFNLHGDLQRDLSQAVINRVSFYGIIHDINKEATAMAANDDSGLNRVPAAGEDVTEDHSPLVEAVKGPCATRPDISISMMQAALIDEEKWLLSAIEKRGDDECRPMQACPPTFLQAMGEREYENPLTSLSSGSRTQLWKPSRSWWEAKSGKNPWIEPKSHNKRWRYLWPLIHYHKFLAKCIKKLKRNGVDVKMSVSPVAAFLREEVCAVSDHLAAVSLFDSEEWMSCLQHFSGWTDTTPTSESSLRVLVGKLFLRPLAEHGDVESPLLRSQIDEQFLRAMASARSQMDTGSDQDRYKHSSKSNASRPPHRNIGAHGHTMDSSLPPHLHVPQQVGGAPPRATGVRRPRYPYSQQWYGHGWHQPPHGHHHHPHQYGPHYGDDASVHSSLSGDAFSEYGMYAGQQGPNGQYYPPVPYHHHPHMDHPHGGGYDPSLPPDHGMYPMHTTPYDPHHAGLGFFGHAPVDPSAAYSMQHQPQEDASGYYGMPPASPQVPPSPAPSQHTHLAPESNTPALIGGVAGDQTPYKHDPSKTPRSPYWGHLDATIAMGLSTPQTHVKPGTVGPMSPQEGAEAGHAGNGQPLLLRQSQFYGYGPVNNYGPPSPATQFMMSPQANFAFNYGYGYSPNQGHLPAHYERSPTSGMPQGTNLSSSLKQAAPGLSPAPPRSKRATSTDDRESPSTVETITESESLTESTTTH